MTKKQKQTNSQVWLEIGDILADQLKGHARLQELLIDLHNRYEGVNKNVQK